MRVSQQGHSHSSALTIAELLVVITLIMVVMGLFATLSGDPDISQRLTTGRQIAWAKLREARGVAAMRQSHARLLIHMDPSQPELMLRSMIIVAETEIGSDEWEPVHEAEKLPRGVCWVPTAGGYGWTGPTSTGGREVTLKSPVAAWSAGATCWAYEFEPSGRISSSRYDLCIAQGSTEGGSPQFRNPTNFRAVRVNSYGQVSELADSKLPR